MIQPAGRADVLANSVSIMAPITLYPGMSEVAGRGPSRHDGVGSSVKAGIEVIASALRGAYRVWTIWRAAE
jgi:hypothetical protein